MLDLTNRWMKHYAEDKDRITRDITLRLKYKMEGYEFTATMSAEQDGNKYKINMRLESNGFTLYEKSFIAPSSHLTAVTESWMDEAVEKAIEILKKRKDIRASRARETYKMLNE